MVTEAIFWPSQLWVEFGHPVRTDLFTGVVFGWDFVSELAGT